MLPVMVPARAAGLHLGGGVRIPGIAAVTQESAAARLAPPEGRAWGGRGPRGSVPGCRGHGGMGRNGPLAGGDSPGPRRQFPLVPLERVRSRRVRGAPRSAGSRRVRPRRCRCVMAASRSCCRPRSHASGTGRGTGRGSPAALAPRGIRTDGIKAADGGGCGGLGVGGDALPSGGVTLVLLPAAALAACHSRGGPVCQETVAGQTSRGCPSHPLRPPHPTALWGWGQPGSGVRPPTLQRLGTSRCPQGFPGTVLSETLLCLCAWGGPQGVWGARRGRA